MDYTVLGSMVLMCSINSFYFLIYLLLYSSLERFGKYGSQSC